VRRLRMKNIDARVEREHQRGLRTVDDRNLPRHCAVPGFKEGREDIIAPGGRIEKMVPTEMFVFEVGRSVERIDRDAERRPRQLRISGSATSSEKKLLRPGASRKARRIISSAATSISFLLIAVGIGAAIPAGDARQRPIRK